MFQPSDQFTDTPLDSFQCYKNQGKTSKKNIQAVGNSTGSIEKKLLGEVLNSVKCRFAGTSTARASSGLKINITSTNG